MGDAVFDRQHDRRPVKRIHQLGGDDADDAAMPPVSGHDEDRARADIGIGRHDLLRGGERRRFLFLPPQVLAVELHRQRPGFVAQRFVGRQQQPGGDVGRAHAPRGVHSRREQERDVIAVDRLSAQARDVEQRPQADLVRAAGQQVQSQLGDDAVLADQRHDVGERADRRDLDEAGQPVVVARRVTQRLHELQRDADAGEVFVGIPAIAALGIDDGEGGRQLRVRLVMIGDDQIHPQLTRAPRRLGAANAAVHRHDQRDPVGMEPLDRGRLQTVAVAQPLRDEVHDVGAEQFQRTPEDDGGRHAVHVVIAVDGNPFAPRDGGEEAIDRDAHVREPHRIVEMLEHGIQEAARELRVAQPALAEETSDGRFDRQGGRQRGGGGLVAG